MYVFRPAPPHTAIVMPSPGVQEGLVWWTKKQEWLCLLPLEYCQSTSSLLQIVLPFTIHNQCKLYHAKPFAHTHMHAFSIWWWGLFVHTHTCFVVLVMRSVCTHTYMLSRFGDEVCSEHTHTYCCEHSFKKNYFICKCMYICAYVYSHIEGVCVFRCVCVFVCMPAWYIQICKHLLTTYAYAYAFSYAHGHGLGQRYSYTYTHIYQKRVFCSVIL